MKQKTKGDFGGILGNSRNSANHNKQRQQRSNTKKPSRS